MTLYRVISLLSSLLNMPPAAVEAAVLRALVAPGPVAVLLPLSDSPASPPRGADAGSSRSSSRRDSDCIVTGAKTGSCPSKTRSPSWSFVAKVSSPSSLA